MSIFYVDPSSLAELQQLSKRTLTFQVVDGQTIKLVGEAGQAQAILTCRHKETLKRPQFVGVFYNINGLIVIVYNPPSTSTPRTAKLLK